MDLGGQELEGANASAAGSRVGFQAARIAVSTPPLKPPVKRLSLVGRVKNRVRLVVRVESGRDRSKAVGTGRGWLTSLK